jgi:SAM-dependent methyltransferase
VVLYTFKPSRYSSHAILPDTLPAGGSGRRVLDLGCSDGFLGALLARRGYQVVGVERSGGYSSNFPAEVELIEADLDQGLPDLPGKFDFVLCADILEHLRAPEELLRQVGAVLVPGGLLIASLPNSGNLYFRLTVLSGRFPREDRGLFDRTHLHFFTLDTWEELFASTGFLMERVQPTGIPVGLAFPRRAESLPVRAAERLSYELARLWKRLFAYQFVVTARSAKERNEG